MYKNIEKQYGCSIDEYTENLFPTPSCYYESPIGPILIKENEYGISYLKFTDSITYEKAPAGSGKYLADAKLQLQEYFDRKRTQFDLPLSVSGSDFQKKVWAALQKIPYGETRSYGQIAEQIGNAKAARAVGMANNRNPIMIIIPCHRVVGKDGSLVGYAGGIERKQKLLELETGSL